jgi:very-short-patch-repair endonuclease
LRKAETWGERILWKALRERKMNFRRQAPVGPYVVDFAHFGSRLIVEIDGYHHTLPERQARDAARDAWFRTEGFRILRIEESALKRDMMTVVDQIVAATAPPPSPTLPPSRGKGAPRYDVR